MLYSEIRFRGNFILGERLRVGKERMVAASFAAWQGLAAHTSKLPTWGRYIKQLGLSSEPSLTREDLKREADHAMKNAQRIIEKARRSNASR
jgi:hypothetical protein